MAAKPGSAPTTYSPNLDRKTRPSIFKPNDLDWVRPDGRFFHQCRPACKVSSFLFIVKPSLLKSFYFFFLFSFWVYYFMIMGNWDFVLVYYIMFCM